MLSYTVAHHTVSNRCVGSLKVAGKSDDVRHIAIRSYDQHEIDIYTFEPYGINWSRSGIVVKLSSCEVIKSKELVL